jgi:hypothetical protein
MTSFARTVSRVQRLVDSLVVQTLAAAEWPLIDSQLTALAVALEAGNRAAADGICLTLERQYCSSPYLLRTFETETSWNARVPAPAATLGIAARVRAADC